MLSALLLQLLSAPRSGLMMYSGVRGHSGQSVIIFTARREKYETWLA